MGSTARSPFYRPDLHLERSGFLIAQHEAVGVALLWFYCTCILDRLGGTKSDSSPNLVA